MPFSIFRLRTLTGANVVALLIAHVAVLDVLLRLALHAAGARLRRARRPGSPTCRWRSGSSSRPGVASPAGHALRLQAGAGRRARARGRRPGVVRAGLDRTAATCRDILFPSLLAAVGLGFAFVPVTIAAVAGVTEHGGRPRERADQHLPAGRRRARPGDPRDGRQQPHERPMTEAGGQPGRAARRADRGLPVGVPGRRGLRPGGRRARHGPDLQPGQPRARGGRPGRGVRARPGRRLGPRPGSSRGEPGRAIPPSGRLRASRVAFRAHRRYSVRADGCPR